MDVDTTVIGLFGVFFLSDIAAMATKLKAFAMPSVYEYLEAELSSGQSDDRRTKCGGPIPISPIRPEAEPSRAG